MSAAHSLALIRSPTQKFGMGLVVKLQTMHKLTILVTFFKSEEYSHRSIGIELVQFSIIAVLFLLLLLLIAR